MKIDELKPSIECVAIKKRAKTTKLERPRMLVHMLLGSPMVLATIAGRKTVTRRRLKVQPVVSQVGNRTFWSWGGLVGGTEKEFAGQLQSHCPYGARGTIIKVKEAAWIWCRKERDGDTPGKRPKFRYVPVGQHVVYAAGHPKRPQVRIDENPAHGWRLKVARFMPGWASRITLEVTDTRAERIQQIDHLDSVKEGLVELTAEAHWHWDDTARSGYREPKQAYAALWTQINGDASWMFNEWIWVVDFRVLSTAGVATEDSFIQKESQPVSLVANSPVGLVTQAAWAITTPTPIRDRSAQCAGMSVAMGSLK